MPYYIHGNRRSGKLDTPDDIARLSSFEDVLKAWRKDKSRYSGIGFALVGGDGVGGVDLDNCLDQDRNFTSKEAKQVFEIAKAAGCYLEVSPSGIGIKGFGFLIEADADVSGVTDLVVNGWQPIEPLEVIGTQW